MMPKVATGFYAVCKGREIGVFTTWDEAQPHVKGFPGAKYKKFRTQPEAELWYRSNLPQRPTDRRTTTATPATAPTTIISTSSSSFGATYTPSKPSVGFISKPAIVTTPRPSLVFTSKPPPQSISRTVTTPALGPPAQVPRIAPPKNTTVDIVYSDGACRANGTPNAVGGIGVWWGPNDPRNISERCPGSQTNNRAELIAIARVLETVPQSSNTLIIRTDSKYSRQSLTEWYIKWRKNGWRNAAGNSVLNKDLIEYTLTLLETRQRSGQPVKIEYVKGHSGDVGNDGADALAVAGCDLPEEPERNWARLKQLYDAEKRSMLDSRVDPVGPIASPPNALVTSSSSTGATYASSKPSLVTAPKPPLQSTSRTTTTPALGPPVQTPRIAAPKNTTVDIVYSDGACRANGTPRAAGGIGVWWGPGDPRNLSERCPGKQSNNRAELIAIARVFETVPQSSNTLTIRTDSEYSRRALMEWSLKWRQNGWRNAAGSPVANKPLIEYILTLLETRQRSGQPVKIEYVKGHSGNVGNDGADALAVAGCDLPEEPERDWVKLKRTYKIEKDAMHSIMGADLEDFILSDEELLRELEDD